MATRQGLSPGRRSRVSSAFIPLWLVEALFVVTTIIFLGPREAVIAALTLVMDNRALISRATPGE